MLLLLSFWISTAVCAYFGWRAGAFSRRWATVVAAFACALLIAGALLARNLHLLPDALILSEVGYLQYTWFTPLAALLFFIAAGESLSSSRRNSRLLKIFVVLLSVFSASRLLDQQGFFLGNLGTSPAKIDHHNVVLQNSSSTCGAASCATLLRHLKIDAGATESAMIPRCQTGMFGSTTLGMAIGLKSVAREQGWSVRILKCDLKSLREQRRPAVVATRYGGMVNHAVAVLSYDENGVNVADPLKGLSWWSNAEFANVYTGEAIVLEK